ncbi:MAG: cystathionine gamma-synthase [Anaerolineae bacterium]|nr:MAG: cystathionine gamma-synthase [Anaerolineae bacterium]
MHQFETRTIHAGQAPDPATGSVMTPIYQTSTFKQEGVGQSKGYEYSRSGNPTRAALEECLASLEGGDYGLGFSSGMAAIDAVLHLLGPGDHLLAVSDLYGGTYRLFESVYAQLGLEFSYASAADPESFVEQMKPSTKLVWLESPTNPLLHLCDIEVISRLAKVRNPEVLVAVDSTFATPYLQRPLEMGADIVQHSTTKYLSGHSDVIGGAIVTDLPRVAERLAFYQNAIGAVPGPFDCFMVLRGIKTLAVRMDRHSANALQIAEHLQEQPGIHHVNYPGLPSHPQYELGMRQMRSAGGMVSFTVEGGAAAAKQLAEATRIFSLAESLGGVESLIEVPAAMTHASTAGSSLEVDPALIRLSVGLEAVGDLIDDLDQALA